METRQPRGESRRSEGNQRKIRTLCNVSQYNREPHRPYSLRASHPVEKTDIKSVEQIITPDVQCAAGKIQSGLGGFLTAPELQVIIPEVTQLVSGKAKASS